MMWRTSETGKVPDWERQSSAELLLGCRVDLAVHAAVIGGKARTRFE